MDEKRLSGIPVSGFREVPGLGRLSRGRVSGGEVVRGARARLLRDGVVIADDLCVGALTGEPGLKKRLEARATVGARRHCAVAIGYGDVREGDHIEVYTPAETTAPEKGRELGRAETLEVIGDPLAGPVARVALAEGRLAVGDRVRVLRGGQPVVEALRLLAMTDHTGRPIGEAAAGAGASLYLGCPELRPGDVVVAYDVPPPRWTEARAHLLDVLDVYVGAELAEGEVLSRRKSPAASAPLVGGYRARVLRDGLVIADGHTIYHVRHPPKLSGQIVSVSSALRVRTQVWLDFRGLRKGDRIEPYRVVPA